MEFHNFWWAITNAKTKSGKIPGLLTKKETDNTLMSVWTTQLKNSDH
jgi:hypothetical protein